MTNKNETRDALRIDHDDQLDEVVDKANRVLRQIGLSFIDDNAVHDGFCLYELREVSGTIPGDRVLGGTPIADRILRETSTFVIPLALRLSALPRAPLNLECKPLWQDMAPFDAVRLSLSLEAAGEKDLAGLWIEDLIIDGRTMLFVPRPAADFSTSTEWLDLPFVPSVCCKFILKMTNRGDAEVHFSGSLLCRKARAAIEAETPVITTQEIAATREATRKMRQIADELDQSDGSLYARFENQQTLGVLRQGVRDRQTIVVERRRTP